MAILENVKAQRNSRALRIAIVGADEDGLPMPINREGHGNGPFQTGPAIMFGITGSSYFYYTRCKMPDNMNNDIYVV
jgi:hypothetical protein